MTHFYLYAASKFVLGLHWVLTFTGGFCLANASFSDHSQLRQ